MEDNKREYNKLIAEFMGLKNHFNNQGVTKVLIDGNEHIQDWECYDAERDILITPIEMKYHTSWDWLMPVIAKIVEDYGSGWSFEEGYDLDVRYKAVVNFIKEYNK